MEVEPQKLTPELRRRFSFLQHLPVTCDIMFIELEISALLSPETLAVFEPQLAERRRRRDQSRKKDERERRKDEQDQVSVNDFFINDLYYKRF